MKKYDPSKTEKKWQEAWKKAGIYNTPDQIEAKKNQYILTEFPYPSGNLHIGHWYAFSIPDIYVRWLRMQGRYNVLYPIGFDAFGLPAENAAIKYGKSPKAWTRSNVEYMTKQLETMGATFDWSRVIDTTDPKYYHWTQWLFLQLFKQGLVYRAKALANWCPSCKTILANEQVIQGHCDRCNTEVVQKEVEQWMFKITDFADDLIDELEYLDWPKPTKTAQENWIGRSRGAKIKFKVKDTDKEIEVFTTRPETIFGATYLVVAPEHRLLKQLESKIENKAEVQEYIDKTLAKTERDRISEAGVEKTGVRLEGLKVVNPLSNKEIPVWIADYVLGSYGTGAIMAVPGHDERDFEFATKFKLEIKSVIKSPTGELPYLGGGELENSGPYNDLSAGEAISEIIKILEKNNQGRATTIYRLRDWSISRQRYWGVPIPMVRCEACARLDPSGQGYQPIDEENLPVELPDLEDFKPSDDGQPPLARAGDWLKVKCPKCGGTAERETDTMDTFVDSSWYFLRYLDPQNDQRFAEENRIKNWLPVDLYIGGAEHNTMHLLYSRFITKALQTAGLLSFSEPFTRRLNHGIILGPDNQKMSKSRGNVIDPDEVVIEHGADAVRMFLAFMGPYAQGGPWSKTGINGISRFIKRVWTLAHTLSSQTNPVSLQTLHQTIRAVGEDIGELAFNTVVSELMKALNVFEEQGVAQSEFEKYLKLLAPLAPHLTEEIWQTVLGHKNSIHLENWPDYDPDIAKVNSIRLILQVNGRVRDSIPVAPGVSQIEAERIAQESEKLSPYLKDKKIIRVIFVPDKLINLVVG
ncbi:MAG: leucine--tRNA ligase [Candidatus Yanofskybacteria bacterium CG10_big_fil_rev_8_21_14_0_10_46_23]|uniref:Leucine--tRNA ligase n=1 Tax=Candidatus Yanofskybacteria bacterium CG10_big_fil_rev_8_21_14_0_10_46_23 TaxID=1975098 RepID=A0A2H0R3M4_9BACT|nr:MAG: leucine--tRNA ligase [Candidatus Yanofskybacteria bacterium CG10_big_fil_rev_8_21_14_0_10_46_23]